MMSLKIRHEHRWDLSIVDARDIQRDLEKYVVEAPLDRPLSSIAGVDVSVKANRVRAVAAVLSFPELELLDEQRIDPAVATRDFVCPARSHHGREDTR